MLVLNDSGFGGLPAIAANIGTTVDVGNVVTWRARPPPHPWTLIYPNFGGAECNGRMGLNIESATIGTLRGSWELGGPGRDFAYNNNRVMAHDNNNR